MMTDKEAQLKAKLLKMKLAAKIERKSWDKIEGISSKSGNNITPTNPKSKLTPLRRMELLNGINADKIAPSSVIEESEIGKKLSDLQEKKLRRGVGAKRPESETLDKSKGKYMFEDNAKKYAISTAKAKIKKLKKTPIKTMEKRGLPENILEDAASEAGVNENQSPSYIAKDHGHRISFRSHSAGNFKTASLNEQSGKYAKYWLLNAKDTNGNGWGIASHTAKENMKKFIGRPLVVTASSWHGASEYGDEYEHPYLPTNDITAILDHQEKFRVGSIVDVVEDSHGDWFASVEMLPKFASSRLPPFCSPAIYQLDASEAEGQISKWEALHLAALTENPAYGARIALLKGTCVGTGSECKVQFKVAKQEATTVCPKKKQKISRLKTRAAFLKGITNKPFDSRKGDELGMGLLDSGNTEIIKGGVKSEYPARGLIKNKDNIITGVNSYTIVDEIDESNINNKRKEQQFPELGSEDKIGSPPTEFTKRLFQRKSKEEDPTEKVIREVKDPEKKKDLLNRLDEKPNEYGPKNFGGTKRKDFGKRIGKLKSRIAAVDQLDLGGNVQNRIPTGKKKYGPGGFLVDQDTIDAFRNKKPYRMNTKLKGRKKEYAFQSDGTSLYQLTPDVPQKRYTIGRWNDKGNLDWSFQGHDSETTILAGRMLGIDIERRKDGLYINGELIDHQSMDFTEIAKENLADGFVSKSKGKKKEMTPEQYQNTLEQSSFQIKSRKKLKEEKDSFDSEKKSEHGELLDRTVVQPNQKRKINKTLGLDKEHNIPANTYGNILDHSIPAKTLKKMGLPRDTPMAITGATPVSHKSHMEREHPKSSIPETFYPKKPKFDPARLRRKTFGVSPDTLKMSKLKARLASLGEQNMTYQDSKKVKIHKKKNMEKHDKS